MTNHDDLLESLLSITAEDLADYQARQAARDRELFASLEEIGEVTPPTYREKQHQRYQQALRLGQDQAAMDALWRAASSLDLLSLGESSHTDLTPARVSELLARLGW